MGYRLILNLSKLSHLAVGLYIPDHRVDWEIWYWEKVVFGDEIVLSKLYERMFRLNNDVVKIISDLVENSAS